jgi:hypothetical protein
MLLTGSTSSDSKLGSPALTKDGSAAVAAAAADVLGLLLPLLCCAGTKSTQSHSDSSHSCDSMPGCTVRRLPEHSMLLALALLAPLPLMLLPLSAPPLLLVMVPPPLLPPRT